MVAPGYFHKYSVDATYEELTGNSLSLGKECMRDEQQLEWEGKKENTQNVPG